MLPQSTQSANEMDIAKAKSAIQYYCANSVCLCFGLKVYDI